MILPTKRLNPNRSLINIGAITLGLLDRPKSISLLWEEFKKERSDKKNNCYITYDWFILSLNLLFIIGAIKVLQGRITKTNDKKNL